MAGIDKPVFFVKFLVFCGYNRNDEGVIMKVSISKYNNLLSHCIFRKNRALAPHERNAVPLGTDHCPVG